MSPDIVDDEEKADVVGLDFTKVNPTGKDLDLKNELNRQAARESQATLANFNNEKTDRSQEEELPYLD